MKLICFELEPFQTLTNYDIENNYNSTKRKFANLMNLAKVIPLFKKGDKLLFENYRPISLLTAISKILERVVFNQLYDHLTKHNLLFVEQYGFRKRHSTEYAALELVDRISNGLDNRKLPISIFLALSKAFDTLDHQILLHKLYHYGIRNSAKNWFSSYLTNRLQYIDIDGTKSNSHPLSIGVPQGSILGPLLFIIYTNDINAVSPKFTFILYADDTTMIRSMYSFTSVMRQDTACIADNINKYRLKRKEKNKSREEIFYQMKGVYFF